ncbi:MAG TPA: hypothetical protein VG713_10280, partial [Pirellulales bacterium]|nr:hypothetical protein [Pirellulales bacterium]
EFQELILAYELRWRAGAAFDRGELADDLQKNVLLLGDLLKNNSLANPGRSSLAIADRVAAARQRFAVDLRPAYDREPLDVRKAMQMRNDAAFRAIDAVRWLGRAVVVTGGNPVAADDLRKLLAGIATLSRRLDDLRTGGTSPVSDPRALRDALTGDQRNLRDLMAAIDARLNTEADLLSRDPRKPGHTQRIEGLLATTLLSATQRQKLLEALPKSESPPPNFGQRADASSQPSPAFDGRRWEALLRQVSLELALLRWGGIDVSEMERALAPLDSGASRRGGPDGDVEAWQALAELGVLVERAYQQLPTRVNESFRAANRLPAADRTASRQGTERLLRLIDARDARLVDAQVAVAPIPQVAKEPQLAVQSPARVDLRSDEWTEIDFTVQSDLGLPGDVWAVLDFDASQLEVRLPGSRTPVLPLVRPDRPSLALDDRGSGVLSFEARAKVEGRPAVRLQATLEIAGKQFPRAVEIGIPAPDRIDLAADGARGTVNGSQLAPPWIGDDENVLALSLFPNRPTTYRLALVNRSQRPQKVQLVVMSTTAEGAGRLHQLPANPTDWPQAGFKPLATIKELALPASGEPVPIPFPAPGAAAPVAPPAAGAAPAPAAPPPADAKQRVALGHGLVCVLTDLARPERRWVKWIDFSAQPPRKYLDAEAAYDRLEGRLKLVVRPWDFDGDGKPDLDRLPPGGSRVLWNVGTELDSGAAMQAEAEVAPPQYEARLFADVPPDAGRNVNVRLTVDGYPRAFVWRVNCGNTTDHLRPLRDMRYVHIASPHEGDAFLAPRAELPVELQVDAPSDAFVDPKDVVELGVDAQLDRSIGDSRTVRLTSDRQLEVFLDELGPDGALKVDNSVHDFKLNLKPLGLANTRVEIGAQMFVGGGDPDKDFVQVILDGSPPKISVSTQPTGGAVRKGTELLVLVKDAD